MQDIRPIKDLKQEKMLPEAHGFRRRFLIGGLVLGVLLVGAALLFVFLDLGSSASEGAPSAEAASVIRDVGKLIMLPEGEIPTVATVTDPESLKDQPFFVNAMVGDKVLIYTNARKAILFRSSENKLVDVAPLNIEQ